MLSLVIWNTARGVKPFNFLLVKQASVVGPSNNTKCKVVELCLGFLVSGLAVDCYWLYIYHTNQVYCVALV